MRVAGSESRTYFLSRLGAGIFKNRKQIENVTKSSEMWQGVLNVDSFFILFDRKGTR